MPLIFLLKKVTNAVYQGDNTSWGSSEFKAIVYSFCEKVGLKMRVTNHSQTRSLIAKRLAIMVGHTCLVAPPFA